VQRWPDEPPAPAPVDARQFRDSVAYLCRKPADRVASDEVLAAAREAGVDPFLLAALMFDRSRCDASKKSRNGFGLLNIQPTMYRCPGAPRTGAHASEWSKGNLLSPRANLGLGARLLRMWQEQHDALDVTYGGVPHRSAVSHFYWGDQVPSSGTEDLVLTARRRLVAHYQGQNDVPRPCSLGMNVVPPLEASPRVATSGPGDDRDGGARRHRGLDVVASPGEPIRAIADGTVIFAGANMRGNARTIVSPAKSARYARKRLGAGGVYMCIRHRGVVSEQAAAAETPDEALPETQAEMAAPVGSKSVVSCYMHLDRFFVATGRKVKAGETIGVVGRSGVRRSPPHLHFELRVEDRFRDPWRYFTDSIMPPNATVTYRYNQLKQKSRLRAVARAQRAKAKAKVLTTR
jgi:murein DD-endopeptidase MepM/ murein hydrolase activator NlpD